MTQLFVKRSKLFKKTLIKSFDKLRENGNALIFLLILLMVSHGAIANPSKPDADPCIQSSNKTQAACLKHQSSLIELPAEAIQKLKINAGFGWGIFNGSIYNGNEDYFVTQLTISMTPIHDHHMEMSMPMSHETKVHQINLQLPPSSKGALSMALAGDDVHVHDFKWEIIKVMGYQTH